MLRAIPVLLLTACATPAQVDPSTAAAANEPLVCGSKSQCDYYWQRAQAWVAQNSRYRVQSATDAVVSTYSPARGSTDYGFTVIREPRADGSARIVINMRCGNMFGCTQQPEEVAANFKRYVRQ